MLIYYFGYAILFVFAGVAKSLKSKDESKYNTALFIVSSIVIVLILGLRHQSMGNDLRYQSSNGYLGAFDSIVSNPWSRIWNLKVMNYERGYIIYNKLVGCLGADRQMFLFITAVFSIVPIMYYLSKNSQNMLLSIIIYLGLPAFLMCFSGLRQSIAIGITSLSMIYIKEKSLVKFILLVLLASTLHSSAIIFLAAYPLYHIKASDKWDVISIISIPVVYVLRAPLFGILSRIFKDEAKTTETGAFTLFAIFSLIYIGLVILNKKQNRPGGYINIFYLACLCQAFAGIYYTAMRVGYYFMIALAVGLPEVLQDMKSERDENKSYKIAYGVVVALFIMYGLYAIKTSTWAMACPYKFFWTQ